MTVLLASGVVSAVPVTVAGSQGAPAEPTAVDRRDAPHGFARHEYRRSQLVIRHRPFKATQTPANVGSEMLSVRPTLKKYKAVFQGAVELSSGVRINFYRSRLDKPGEPLVIDYRALDVLINETIRAAGDLGESPAATQVAELQRLATQGRLELLWNIVAISDETKCINDERFSEPHARPFIPRSDPSDTCTTGMNAGYGVKYLSVSNQIGVLLDVGRSDSRSSLEFPEYYELQGQRRARRLGPDQWMALTTAHEAAHALFALTGMAQVLSPDDEHDQFVHPIESAIYTRLSSLPKQSFKYVSPLHVDSRRTSQPDRP